MADKCTVIPAFAGMTDAGLTDAGYPPRIC